MPDKEKVTLQFSSNAIGSLLDAAAEIAGDESTVGDMYANLAATTVALHTALGGDELSFIELFQSLRDPVAPISEYMASQFVENGDA